MMFYIDDPYQDDPNNPDDPDGRDDQDDQDDQDDWMTVSFADA